MVTAPSAIVRPTAARAQTPQEVVIGVIYPLSGASAQIGVDAQHAFNTAGDIINTAHDLDLPLAKGAGLPGLGGAKVEVVFADNGARFAHLTGQIPRELGLTGLALLGGAPEVSLVDIITGTSRQRD